MVMLARLYPARAVAHGTSILNWIKHHKKIAIPILIILVILAFVLRPKPPAPLETTQVKKGDITQTLTSSGTIQAKSSVNLSFLTGGKVTYVGAEEGETVTKGQTIAVLDQRSIQKNMENALRDYAKQRNTFEQSKEDNNQQTPQTAADKSVRRVLENNQFDLEKAVASVELQELARQQSVLTAPIAGVLIRSDIPVAGVNAGPTNIFTIADPDSLVFAIDVDEADIGKVSEGLETDIVLDAYPEQKLHGTVSSIDFSSHKTDTGGNAFTVEVKLPVTAMSYRIGMNGDAEVLLNKRYSTLIIPLAAIVDDTYVYVKKDTSYEKRKITLGLQNDTDAEVTDGLTEGEIITLQPEEAAKMAKVAKSK